MNPFRPTGGARARMIEMSNEELKAADERLSGVSQALQRHQSLEDELRELWAYVQRRALSEAVKANLLNQEPLALSKKGKQAVEADPALAQDLRRFYRKQGKNLSDEELFKAVEREFGERILMAISIPLGRHAGSCVLAAVHYCQEHENHDG